MKECPSCRSPVDHDDRFCSFCGEPLDDAERTNNTHSSEQEQSQSTGDQSRHPSHRQHSQPHDQRRNSQRPPDGANVRDQSHPHQQHAPQRDQTTNSTDNVDSSVQRSPPENRRQPPLEDSGSQQPQRTHSQKRRQQDQRSGISRRKALIGGATVAVAGAGGGYWFLLDDETIPTWANWVPQKFLNDERIDELIAADVETIRDDWPSDSGEVVDEVDEVEGVAEDSIETGVFIEQSESLTTSSCGILTGDFDTDEIEPEIQEEHSGEYQGFSMFEDQETKIGISDEAIIFSNIRTFGAGDADLQMFDPEVIIDTYLAETESLADQDAWEDILLKVDNSTFTLLYPAADMDFDNTTVEPTRVGLTVGVADQDTADFDTYLEFSSDTDAETFVEDEEEYIAEDVADDPDASFEEIRQDGNIVIVHQTVSDLEF